MKASERIKMLEQAETRALVHLSRLTYDKGPYYWKYEDIRFGIWERMKVVQHLAHLEERDELWPNGLPAHP